MNEFTTYNTDGYSDNELKKMNEEWQEIVIKSNLEEFTEEYNFNLKTFADNISRKTI